jgi:hypothetical protein
VNEAASVLRRHLQMRIEQRHPGIEPGLDLCEFDFSLGLDLLTDGVVPRLLHIELCLVYGGGLIDFKFRTLKYFSAFFSISVKFGMIAIDGFV